jgi:AraC family transcriptional regulator
LDDVQRVDGETFSDSSNVARCRDLRGRLTFAPAGCALWGWGIVQSAGSFTALYFDPGQMEEALAQKLRDVPGEAHLYFYNPALRSTLEKIRRSLAGVALDDTMYLESLCMLAALELGAIHKDKAGTALRPAGRLAKVHAETVIEYVDTNLARDIGLNELAGLVGLSRFHFARAFKRTVQESPYQYLLHRRIERAQALLKSTDMSVAEVAVAVGFRNTTRFIRAFRRTSGRTPGAYRS